MIKYLWLVAFVFFSWNCQKRKSDKDNKQFATIKTDGIYFTRAYDRESGILSLELLQPGYCKLEYWPLGTDSDQISNSTKSVNCSNTRPQQKYDIRLLELAKDSKYVFKITAWPESGYNEIFIAKESPVDTYQPPEEPFGELIVARLDIPLKSASVHRYAYKTEVEKLEFAKSQTRKTGCEKGDFTETLNNNFSEASPNIKVENISARGFATSNAYAHPFNLDVKVLNFETLQFGDRMEWTYDLGTSSFRVYSKHMNSFKTLQVTSGQAYDLQEQAISEKQKVINFSDSRDINLTWQTTKKSDNEQVLVFIVDKKSKLTVTCVYNAKDTKGSIPKDLFSDFEQKTYSFIVYLEDRQLLPVEGGTNHSWFIQTYDWRSALVDKT